MHNQMPGLGLTAQGSVFILGQPIGCLHRTQRQLLNLAQKELLSTQKLPPIVHEFLLYIQRTKESLKCIIYAGKIWETIIQSMSSAHDEIKLEINTKNATRKSIKTEN